MKRHGLAGWGGLLLVCCSLWAGPMVQAQTQVVVPKNNFPIEEDMKLGREYAQYYEARERVIKDAEIVRFIQTVGARLVAAIAPEYRQTAFQFSFKVLENQALNAFALPGGPMFVHSEAILQAGSEGELAGIMAHEISHVILRHGTAGNTRRQDNQSETVAEVLSDPVISDVLGDMGGVVVGSQVLSSRSYLNVYGREDETQADILGAQILTRAGYDPRDMVRMLQLLEKLGGSGQIPPWAKSHPDTSERVARVTREIAPLPVPRTPFATGQFTATQARLRRLVPAQANTAAPAPPTRAKNPPPAPQPAPNRVPARAPVGYQARVLRPSAQVRTLETEALSISVPENWFQYDAGGQSIFFAPAGAYGEQGITHGIMFGVHQEPQAKDGQAVILAFVQNLLKNNAYLQVQGRPSQATLGGRSAGRLTLAGLSPVTRRNENVTLYLKLISEDTVFYLLAVVPENESAAYQPAFTKITDSLRLGSQN